MLAKLLLTATLATVGAGAHALTGNEWLAYHTGQERSYVQGLAHGYGVGVARAMNGVSPGQGINCFMTPVSATNGQLLAVIQKHIEENPSSRHLPADVLIFGALFRAYPCPK